MISIPWNPERRQLRQFAGIWFPAFCALLGWVIGKRTGQWRAVEVVWAICSVQALAGLIYPASIRPVFLGLIVATFPLGWAVSHVLLAVIYYGVLLPVGMILRATGHDPLQLRSPPKNTLWKTPVGKNESAHYLRQS